MTACKWWCLRSLWGYNVLNINMLICAKYNYTIPIHWLSTMNFDLRNDFQGSLFVHVSQALTIETRTTLLG